MAPAQLAVCSNGLQLDNGQIQDCINQLRLLVMADPSIIQRTDDLYLLRYLHCTNFNVNEAYKKIKLTNELRLEYGEWFCHKSPESHLDLLRWQMKAMLPGRDKEGRRIYLTKIGRLDATKTSIQEMAQFDDLWFESVLDEPETQSSGICCVVDMSGYSWKMFRWLTPGNIRTGTACVDAMPVKHLVVHVVNSSVLMNASVALVFPFISNRIKQHIHFHYQNWSSLHKYIEPQSLPEEYGGTQNIDFSERNQWLLDQAPRLLENFHRDNRIVQ